MTTNAIELFTYENHQVRTVVIDSEPWFVLADLCAVLHLNNVKDVKDRLGDGVDQIYPIQDSLGRTQQATIVSEPGMYEVVIRSDKPEAIAFRRWITTEVLPSIRKTGSYGTQPVDMASAAASLTTAEWVSIAATLAQRAEAAEAQVAVLEPAAHKWAEFIDADGTYTLNAVAKVLGVGRNTLMIRMREDRVLTRDNLPVQQHMNAGRFVVKVGEPWTKPDGTMHVSRSTRVTAKGAEWLADKYSAGLAIAVR